MKLYWLEAENRYVHRQADIPKGMEAEPQDIPTDLPSLMAHLNSLHEALAKTEQPTYTFIEQVPKAPLIDFPPPPPPPSGDDGLAYVDPDPPMSACAVLSRIDNPKIPVDDVVETIGTSKGYALRRYAGAVALRFEELSKK